MSSSVCALFVTAVYIEMLFCCFACNVKEKRKVGIKTFVYKRENLEL